MPICSWIIDASPLHVRCVPLSSDEPGLQHQQEELFANLLIHCAAVVERARHLLGERGLNCSV